MNSEIHVWFFKIITSCLDGKLKIWDCRNGDELITLHGHKDQILDLALEGFSCTTASDDCTVRYWDLRELKEREENQAWLNCSKI